MTYWQECQLSLKYNNSINEVTACFVYFKQCPKQLPKESGAIHQSPQLMRDWKIDYIDSFHVTEASNYASVYVGIPSGLTQGFPCHYANQTATIMGLEKLSTVVE